MNSKGLSKNGIIILSLIILVSLFFVLNIRSETNFSCDDCNEIEEDEKLYDESEEEEEADLPEEELIEEVSELAEEEILEEKKELEGGEELVNHSYLECKGCGEGSALLPQINETILEESTLNESDESNINGSKDDLGELSGKNFSLNSSQDNIFPKCTSCGDRVSTLPSKIEKDNEIEPSISSEEKGVLDKNNENKYVDLENIESEVSQEVIKKTKLICFNQEGKSFEGKLDEDINCDEISKKEVLRENKKEVIIKSEDHIEDPITVYTDIKGLAVGTKGVEVFWKNKEKLMRLEYYDEDADGFYDRISWIVPHLSEQTFEVLFNFSSSNSSSNINLVPLNVPSGVVTNPVKFNFSIDYVSLSDLNCTALISAKYHDLEIDNSNLLIDLPEGVHNWTVTCYDKNNPSVTNQTLGSFTIDEDLEFDMPHKVYLLNNNEEINLNINSNNQVNVSISLINPDGISSNLNENFPSNSLYTVPRSVITKEGTYKVNVTFNSPTRSITRNFSIASIEIDYDKNNVNLNEEVEISIDVSSPDEKISISTVYFGDGKDQTFIVDDHSLEETIKHAYEDEGTFSVNVTANIDGRFFSILKNGIEVENKGDGESPTIELINPANDEVIRNSTIFFYYKSYDNEKVANCSYELYNSSGVFGVLDYSTTNTDIKNNDLQEVRLYKFDEGEYTWIVECYDESNNYNQRSRDFVVSFSNATTIQILGSSSVEYEKKDALELAISNIENFTIKKETYGLEEKEVIEDYGIDSDLTYYKKRLNQIRTDLINNLKFINDDSLREERRQAALDELDEIEDKIPLSVEIKNSHEFVKNSISRNLEEVLKEHMDSNGLSLNSRQIKNLADKNRQIQGYATISTSVKNVKIEYTGETKEITIITKNIEIKNDSFNSFLEVIPKDILGEAIFITDNTEIDENSIYEIDKDLEESKIIYYVEKIIEPKIIEESETILFSQFPIESFSITGFSVISIDDLGSASYIFLIILVILIVYLLYICLDKLRIYKWKKEENVVKIFDLVKKCKRNLKKGKWDQAREKYHKIKELYVLIEPSCKRYLYKDIKRIRIAIDKKDIFNLIKEYEESKKQGRAQDSIKLYEFIKEKYKKLPKKYQEKVYNKMFKSS